MAEEKKQVKFKVGDRVISVDGLKGTVTRLGRDERTAQVKWDGGMQQLTDVSTLKKEVAHEKI